VSAAALTLGTDERDVALAEVDAVRAAVPEGDYSARLDEIRASIDGGDPLDEDEVHELERLVAIALQSGRVRALYGPGGEQALLRLYRKLPSGRELAETAAEVTEALGALRGATLEGVSIGAVGPGAYTLTLAAGGASLTVHLGRHGARLATVEA
jgi:hypothetical protein